MRVTKEQIVGAFLALLALVGIYSIIVFSVWVIYSSRIYPRVTIAGQAFSFKTEDEVARELKATTAKTETITVGNVAVKKADIELTFDITQTVKKAIGQGQNNPFILGTKVDVPIAVKFNQKKLYEILKKQEKSNLVAVENPVGKKIDGNVAFEGGKRGVRLNYAESANNLVASLGSLKTESELSYYSVEPTFTSQETSGKTNDLLPAQFELKSGEKIYPVSQEVLSSWLSVPANRKSMVQVFQAEPFFDAFFSNSLGYFSITSIEDYLISLGSEINRLPVSAQLTAKEGKVVVAKAETEGRALNVSASAQTIAEKLTQKETKAELVVEIQKAEIRSDNLAELGLVELVSTGYSNFAGSPVNRIHNVRTGASKFNGTIIKPGAEFSFNTVLGPVDASTGYLPELVILENKTQPQFGGGLCQVSSTAFRAALNAGFPILERKAHAYPVSYYKPFGVDATIYLPKPDFRFKNDSSSHILVQTRIVGKNLYFDFYGTKPKRRVTFAAGANATGAVPIVEKVTPYIYDQGARGARSFSAMFYRFIYDESGKLINSKFFLSKYDSPDKYPH